MSKLRKVISGGQTGVDQGGLAAALKLKIPIGGWAPRGFRCENGVIPKKYAIHMKEAEVSNYPARTEMNVLEGDATLIYCSDISETKGTKLTIYMCKKHRKPWFDIVSETSLFSENEDGYQHMANLLKEFEVLNVAGPRESGSPGIFDATKARLYEIFIRIRYGGG